MMETHAQGKRQPDLKFVTEEFEGTRWSMDSLS